MYGNANRYEFCQAMRSSVAGIGGAQGFKIQETGSVYTACVAERYATGFIITSYAQGCKLHGPYTESGDVALVISGDPGPKGCHIDGLFATSQSHATLAAVRVLDSEGTTIVAPFVANNTSDKSLEIGDGAVTLMVRGGVLDDGTPYSYTSGCTARIEDVSAGGVWLDWSST